jgi:serine/threonine protein kinase
VKHIPDPLARQVENQRLLDNMAVEYDLGLRSKHKNVAQYYGMGQDHDGDICLVMELLEGGDYRDLILNPSKRSKINDLDLFRYLD